MSKYTYSISADFPDQHVDSSRLTVEIQGSAIVAVLTHIDTTGDVCDIYFNADLSGEDETILNGLVAAHVPAEIGSKNFLVAEYNSRGNVTKETWYGTDDGDGTYSDPVEETVYTYGGAADKLLLSKTVTDLFTDGTPVAAPVVWEYVTNGDVKIMKKVGA